MKCLKCGAKVLPGQKFCASCGAKVEEGAATAVLTITGQEAACGCQKFVQLPGLAAAMRINLNPGIHDGALLQINNARFFDQNGIIVTRPLVVTVRVHGRAHAARQPRGSYSGNYGGRPRRRRWWIPVIIILAVLCLIGIIAESSRNGKRSANEDSVYSGSNKTNQSSASSNSIIGRWTNDRGDEIEFFSDGTTAEDGYSGTYSISGNRMRIQHPGETTETLTFSIDGDVMHLTDDSGNTGTLYRIGTES